MTTTCWTSSAGDYRRVVLSQLDFIPAAYKDRSKHYPIVKETTLTVKANVVMSTSDAKSSTTTTKSLISRTTKTGNGLRKWKRNGCLHPGAVSTVWWREAWRKLNRTFYQQETAFKWRSGSSPTPLFRKKPTHGRLAAAYIWKTSFTWGRGPRRYAIAKLSFFQNEKNINYDILLDAETTWLFFRIPGDAHDEAEALCVRRKSIISFPPFFFFFLSVSFPPICSFLFISFTPFFLLSSSLSLVYIYIYFYCE